MKNVLLAIACLFNIVAARAQSPLKATEVTANMSKGMKPGFEIAIPQASAKDVEKDWKHHITIGNKAKLTETNGEIVARGLDYKDIAPQPFNMYAVVTSTEGGSKLTVWVTYNDSVFLSQKEATGMSRYMRDFATAEYYLAVKNAYHSEPKSWRN